MTSKTELMGTARLMFRESIGVLRMPRVTFEGEGAAAGGGEGAAAGAAAGAGEGGSDGGAGGASGGGEGGAAAGSSTEWRKLITDPDALKEAERTTDLNAGFKRIAELRGQLSKAIIKPGKDAKPEEVAAYRKAMEIPDAADGYKIERPDHIDEETFSSEPVKAALGAWTAALHEAGASQAVVTAAANTYFAMEKAALTAQIEADKAFAKSSEDALKTEWGADTDKNKEFAKRGFEKLATDAGLDVGALKKIETKDGRFLMDRPEFSKLFAKIGREMGEGQIGSVLSDGDVAGVKDQIAKLQGEKNAALAKGDHAKANELNEKQRELYAKVPA
jgi:hypothetical protein